jgi:hypothetical protein
MMVRRRVLRMWLRLIYVTLALTVGCHVPRAAAAMTFVDNSLQSGDGDSYYVVFFGRPSNPDPRRPKDILSGYMFVGFGVENKIKGLGRFEAFGLYPDQTHPGQRVLFGAVPDDITEEEIPAIQEIIPRVPKELAGHADSDHATSFILKVDKSDWDRVYAAAKAKVTETKPLSSPPVKYKIFMLNCVGWIAEQAVSVGLRLPSPDAALLGAWLPSSFMKAMINANTGFVDHARQPDGTTWTGSTFQGRPHGSGTMAWPNAAFVGLARRGHRARGITTYGGGNSFDGAYDIAGELLAGTYKWQDGAKYDGKYDHGKESEGTYTNADGWRLSGSFEAGRWHAGAITSPDRNSVFKGSVNASGNLVGTRDEKGNNGRRLLNLHDDGSVDGEIRFNDGDSYKGTFQPDSLLPLKGVYRVASSGAIRTGVFGPDYQLQDGTIADPILMFPVPVSGGKIEGGDRPSPPSMGFVAAAPFPATPPSRLPGYSPVRPDGDQRG